MKTMMMLMLMLMGAGEAAAQPYATGSLLYNPADSVLYWLQFAPGDREGISDSAIYTYRFTAGGSHLESSLPYPYYSTAGAWLTIHDHLPSRLYAYGLSSSGCVSNDGGDHWNDFAPGNGDLWLCAPGEQQGESFAYGLILRNWPDENIPILCSTTNSWETWDTSYAREHWPFPQGSCIFGPNNGRLIDAGWMDSLAFSNDTGNTWTWIRLGQNPLPVSGGEEGFRLVEGEFYQGDGRRFYCIQDSGRRINGMLNCRRYGEYYIDPDPWNPSWGSGDWTSTDLPGELYVVLDSVFFDREPGQTGVKLDVFHVTNYGENVNIYSYLLTDYEPREPTSARLDSHSVPVGFVMSSAYPNPFNSLTRFAYSLPSPGQVRLGVYDESGRLVRLLREEFQPAGSHIATWDAGAEPTGPYFLRLQSSGAARVQKVILVR